MIFKKLLSNRLVVWLIAVLLSLLALPFGVSAQSAPSNIQLSSPTAASLVLSWNVVNEATGYEYEQVLPRFSSPVAVAGGGTSSVTISGLGPATLYGFRMRTVFSGSKSAWSFTATAYTTPTAPRNLRAICVAGTEALVAWDSPDLTGQAAGQGLTINYQVSGIIENFWGSRHTARAVRLGLSLNTAYTIRVRALFVQSSTTVYGPEASLQLTTASTHINAPRSLRISNLTNNSVDLAWDASSTDTVSSYDVTSDGGATWVDSGSDLTHSFTNLSSNTAYRLNVRAKSGEILSCGADRAITATTLATAPTGLTTSGITQTAITLNWTKLTGATTSYEVNGGALTEWTDVGDVA
ncbi:MAG: fibronectin type III domain-containing protein, partial [Chloroflexi bacterium]|nr:fibronectin type III domain-containing protein [Chloroflexota bacterium]